MDLALNNLQRLICHKSQPTNQPTNQPLHHGIFPISIRLEYLRLYNCVQIISIR